MVINGLWHQCDDEVTRPIIQAEVLASDGSWVKAPFLLDTGADRTVFSADVLAALGLPLVEAAEHLGGIGGVVESVVVETQIRLTRDNRGKVLFRSHYAGVAEVDALDMSVFGRDLTNLFVVIVDWPQQVVCLLGQHHRYSITQQ